MKTKEPLAYAKPVIGIITWAILLSSALAEDWPQWQGPDRNAISKETGLLKEWPKDGPPLAWKITELGGGDSAPAIAAGRIFGMSNRGEDEIVWALSEKDGKELWVSRLGPAIKPRMSQSKEGPSCTPTVDGDRLYVEGLDGDVSCLQVKDGKILWQRSLTRDFGGRVPAWSFRESPLIDGDKVICTPGAQDAMLVALDKLTGKTIWKSEVPALLAPRLPLDLVAPVAAAVAVLAVVVVISAGFHSPPVSPRRCLPRPMPTRTRSYPVPSSPLWPIPGSTALTRRRPAKSPPSSSPSASMMPSQGRRTHGARHICPGTTAPQPQHRTRLLCRRRCRQGWFTHPCSNFKNTFTKWYDQWDADKAGALTEEKFRSGLTAALPQPSFRAAVAVVGGGRWCRRFRRSWWW